MKYSELIEALQKQTGMDEEQVRSVLSSLPKVLGELDENEQVRTPLGTFAARQSSSPTAGRSSARRRWS